MRVIVRNEIPEDQALRFAWNNVASKMERPEVFYTYEWALAVSRAFRETVRPLLLLVYDSDQLIGVASLAVSLKASRLVCFLGHNTADYCDILSQPENRQAVLVAVFEQLKELGLRELILANLPKDSSTFRELRCAASEVGFHLTSRAAYQCRVVKFGDEGARQVLLRKVARKERERRGLKKLATIGSIRIRHLTTQDCVNASIESIVSAQVARFLASGRISPLIYSERRIFLTELAALLASAGWLKISELEVAGQPVAWNYGFRFSDTWFWYLPTFRMLYESAAPGSCLLRLLLEEACNDPAVQWLDLGLGDEPYKERFADQSRATIYAQLSLSFFRHLIRFTQQIMTVSVSHFPSLKKQLVTCRDLFRAFAKRLKERELARIVNNVLGRAIRIVICRDEVLFFRASLHSGDRDSTLELEAMTWEHLAEAALCNAQDAPTLHYLIRCAKRLNDSIHQGFVLRACEGKLVHFLWLGEYEDFYVSEIDQKVRSASDSDDGVIIFDCWTPLSDRGRGCYATAIQQLASRLMKQGRQVWIFCVPQNQSSLRGIVKSGFDYQFSLTRFCICGHSTVTRSTSSSFKNLV